MSRRVLLFFASIAACCTLAGIALATQVKAAGEYYSWVDYSTIGVRDGSFRNLGINSEGDTPAVNFIQSKNDPALFVAKVASGSCTGEAKLAISSTPNSNQATFTPPGGCTGLIATDRVVEIHASDIIISAAKADSQYMYGEFEEKNCKPPEQLTGSSERRYKECKDAAKQSYDDKSKYCLGQANYEQSAHMANKYLDCLANTLCVERPKPAQALKEPKEEDAVKCAIPYIGWLLCQVLQLEAWITDFSFTLLSNFLEIDPLDTTVQQTAKQKAVQSQASPLADEAKTYCQSRVSGGANSAQADKNSALVAACKNGYTNATGDGTTCNTWLNPPEEYSYYANGVELRASCQAGFEEKQRKYGDKTQEITKENLQKPQTVNNHTVIYTAWLFFLGFTNLIFIAIFLMLVYSYLTGWGLGSFNLKLIGPRLIVSIILVNASFWICALTVDVSNILGKTLRDTFVDITPPQTTGTDPKYSNWTAIANWAISRTATDGEAKGQAGSQQAAQQQANSNQPNQPVQAQCTLVNQTASQNQNTQTPEQGVDESRGYETNTLSQIKVAGATLSGAIVLFILLAVLIPSMTVVLLTLALILILLMLRQAVVIILVVIAPIAFALNALPSTKQWFEKWRKTFFTTVMLYPAIALIYGASYFAASALRDRGLQYDSILIIIFSFTMQVIPLIFTLTLVKMGGTVLGKASDVLTSDKSPFGKVKAMDEDRLEGRRIRRMGDAAASAMNGRFDRFRVDKYLRRRSAKKQVGRSTTSSLLNQAKQQHAANASGAREAAASGLTNDQFAADALAKGSALAAKSLRDLTLQKARARTAELVNESDGMSRAADRLIANSERDTNNNPDGVGEVEEVALVQAALHNATDEVLHKLIEHSGEMSALARQVLVEGLRKNGFSKRNAQFGGAALQMIEDGGMQYGRRDENGLTDSEKLLQGAIESNKFSASAISEQSETTLKAMRDMRNSGILSDEADRALSGRARSIEHDSKLSGNATGDRGVIIQELGIRR